VTFPTSMIMVWL